MADILASKNVVSGSEINVLHKFKEYWIALSKDDDISIAENLEENLLPIDEELIYQRIPYLRNKLEQPEETTINIEYATGEISINPKHFHFGIPTHFAKSTRQVNIAFSFFRWIAVNWRYYVRFLFLGLALIALAIFVGWFFYIPFAVYFGFELLSLLKTRDMFKSGDLCLGIVIDDLNTKIAVFTDLSLGIGNYPIIRIKKVALPRRYNLKGTLLPIAGGYYNTEKYPHWNCFEPLPIPSGNGDMDLIKAKLKSIPPNELLRLKAELKKLPPDPVAGYYPINIETTSWKERKLFDIKWVK